LYVFKDLTIYKKNINGRETYLLNLTKEGLNKYYKKVKNDLKNFYISQLNDQPMKVYFNPIFGSPRICYNTKAVLHSNSRYYNFKKQIR